MSLPVLPRLRRAAALGLLGLVLAGAGGCGDAPGGGALPPGSAVTADSGDAAGLRAAFQQGDGRVRIVALLSPT